MPSHPKSDSRTAKSQRSDVRASGMPISVYASGSAGGPRVVGGSPVRLPRLQSPPTWVPWVCRPLRVADTVCPGVSCKRQAPRGAPLGQRQGVARFSIENHEVCSLPETRTALDAQRASLHRSLQNGAILLPSGTGWNANVKKKISLHTSQFTYKRQHRSFILSLDLPIFNLRLFEIIWSVGDHW